MRLIAVEPWHFLWGWSKGWQRTLSCSRQRSHQHPSAVLPPHPPARATTTTNQGKLHFRASLCPNPPPCWKILRPHQHKSARLFSQWLTSTRCDLSQTWGHIALLNTGPSSKGPATPRAFTPLPTPARSQNLPVQHQALPKSLSATSSSTWTYLPTRSQHTPSAHHPIPPALGCLLATRHRGTGLALGNLTSPHSQNASQMPAVAGHP